MISYDDDIVVLQRSRKFIVSRTLSVFAIATVLGIYIFQILSPPIYLHLISEDFFGEYLASLFFVTAGAVFIIKGVKQQGISRLLAVLLGAAMLFIGGEEVSWGQRLLEVPTPEALEVINKQGEITLHNIGFLQTFPFHEVVGVGLLFTLALIMLKNKRNLTILLDVAPLPSLEIWPIFVITAVALIFQPFLKGDEISDIFLGASCLIWACILGQSNAAIRRGTALKSVAVAVSSCIAAALVITANTPPDRLAWRANITASRDYPDIGQYRQADDYSTSF